VQREAEIAELHATACPVGVEDILGFHVPMSYLMRMQVGERRNELVHDKRRVRLGEAVPVSERAQVPMH
jgi:hypothetical protein